MRVLGIDVETTGLEAGEDHIIEIGAVLWDTEAAKPLSMVSETIISNKELSEEIQGITGITPEQVKPPIAKPIGNVLYEVECMAHQAERYVAHNAEFDRQFLEYAAHHFEFPWVELPWIDTITDVPYPDKITTRKLTFLAAEHGFLILDAHRALFDVMAMLRVTSHYDWDKILWLADSPTIKVIGKQKFEDNHLVKAKGFRWDGEAKRWGKEVKKVLFDEECKTYDFPYEVGV